MTSVEYLPRSTQTSTRAASNGAAWAAVLAASIGCACFGLLADLTELSPRFKAVCNIYNPSGDLAGKSTGAVIVWVVVWVILHLSWRSVSLKHSRLVAAIAVVLILASLAATFPPTFELLAGK